MSRIGHSTPWTHALTARHNGDRVFLCCVPREPGPRVQVRRSAPVPLRPCSRPFPARTERRMAGAGARALVPAPGAGINEGMNSGGLPDCSLWSPGGGTQLISSWDEVHCTPRVRMFVGTPHFRERAGAWRGRVPGRAGHCPRGGEGTLGRMRGRRRGGSVLTPRRGVTGGRMPTVTPAVSAAVLHIWGTVTPGARV